MRQRVDVVQLKETAQSGYQFNVGGAEYSLRYDDGAWRLLNTEGNYELFESFNEALNFALDGSAL